MKSSLIFGLHAQQPKWLKWVLAAIPFLLLVIVYQIASDKRLEENPQDKLLPSFSQMADAVDRMAFQEDRRTGEYLLWVDTASI